MVTHGNIGTFPFVYSLVSRIYTVPNVDIEILMIKQESSWHRIFGTNQKQVSSFLEMKWIYESRRQDLLIENNKYTTLPW